MLIIVVGYSAFLISLGVYGIAQPIALVGVAQQFVAWPGIWLGFVLRFIFATALWVGAESSYTPTFYRVLAVLTGLAALSLPVLGTTELTRFVQWFAELPREYRQAWAGASLAVGTLTLWSAVRSVRR